MKRTIVLFFAAVMCVSLVACGTSKAEREAERARETVIQMEEQLEIAKKNADKVRQDIEEYNRLVDALNDAS